MSQLKVAIEAEVFADPPAFKLEQHLRRAPDYEEVQSILKKYHDAKIPRRTKMLLEDFLK